MDREFWRVSIVAGTIFFRNDVADVSGWKGIAIVAEKISDRRNFRK
jgi:hypothetical protein